MFHVEKQPVQRDSRQASQKSWRSRKAMRAAQALMGWRPIDDAAKSGEDILAWGPRQNRIVVAWDPEIDRRYPWISVEGTQYPEAAFTHYQPLDPPPDLTTTPDLGEAA